MKTLITRSKILLFALLFIFSDVAFAQLSW
jgi:hypothetical protein